MKKVVFFLSLIWFAGCKLAQPSLIPSDFNCELFNFPVKDFKIDVFGNIYLIKPNNSLTLYDENLKEQFHYFNNGLGQISYIDITNPRKILVFFKDFQKVVFLDNTLSEIGRFEWRVEEALDIKAIGSSRDNNIWIYDGLDYRLKKMNAKGTIILSTNPLQTHFEIDIAPDYIIEKDNQVFMVEEGKKVLVFDNFGNFIKTISAPMHSFNLDRNFYYFIDLQGNFCKQSIQNVFSETEIILSLPNQVKSVQLRSNNLYYIKDFCLQVEKID